MSYGSALFAKLQTAGAPLRIMEFEVPLFCRVLSTTVLGQPNAMPQWRLLRDVLPLTVLKPT